MDPINVYVQLTSNVSAENVVHDWVNALFNRREHDGHAEFDAILQCPEETGIR